MKDGNPFTVCHVLDFKEVSELKAALVVSTPDAEFEALAFKDSLKASVERVARLGYDGVEIAIRDPRTVKVSEIVNMVKEKGIEVPAIGTGQAFGQEGLSLSSPDKDIRQKALARLKLQIEFASNFNAKVILGLIRGKVQRDVKKEDAIKWMIEGIEECADYAKRYNVKILIEPINRYEIDLINTVEECLDIIKIMNRDNVFILVDTFHMNIEEPSITDSIRNANGNIGHVHVADSNRWAPGFGHIDFKTIYEVLKEVGYDGYISAEILPKPDPETAAQQAIKVIKGVFT